MTVPDRFLNGACGSCAYDNLLGSVLAEAPPPTEFVGGCRSVIFDGEPSGVPPTSFEVEVPEGAAGELGGSKTPPMEEALVRTGMKLGANGEPAEASATCDR